MLTPTLEGKVQFWLITVIRCMCKPHWPAHHNTCVRAGACARALACMYGCMYVCMSASRCIRMLECLCARTPLYDGTHVCSHGCTYASVHSWSACVYPRACMYVCMCACVCMCARVWVRAYVFLSVWASCFSVRRQVLVCHCVGLLC
jgi:hypothetical protein